MPNWSTRFLLPSNPQSTPQSRPSNRSPELPHPLASGADRHGSGRHRSLQTSASVAVLPNPRRLPEHSRSSSQQAAQNNIRPPTTPSSAEPMLSLRKSEGDLDGPSQIQARGPGSESLPQTIPNQTVGRVSVRRPVETQEMITGPCICCDSSVRWPKGLTQFRCTICRTVNTITPPAVTESPEKVARLSRTTVRNLLHAAKREFINGLTSTTSSGNVLPSEVPTETSTEKISSATSNPENLGLRLSLNPPPAHPTSGTISEAPTKSWAYIKLALGVFKPLEEYIHASFSSWECMNTSFMPPAKVLQPVKIAEDTLPNFNVPGAHPTLDDFVPVTGTPGEKEAMMLTLGHAVRKVLAETRTAARASPHHERKASVRAPPGIDWKATREFYDLLLTAGDDIISEIRASREKKKSNGLPETEDDHYLDEIELALHEARVGLLIGLLRTTESFLKRPGRPFKKPDETRFLMVLLANPLLSPGSVRYTTSKISPGRTLDLGLSSPGSNATSPAGIKHRTDSGGPGHNAFLVKRIFGILSNLPNECHHYLVAWLSVAPPRIFRELVELGGTFTTHRITHDINKKNHRGKFPYSDDWQLKTTARVMTLLEKANNDTLGRRKYLSEQLPVDPDHLSPLDLEARRRGQLVPISLFYNMRVDYLDIIADFEAWEKKETKFCFSQYPFYLSMGAKATIIDHDSKRQMEGKARTAFITNISNRTALSAYMNLKVRRDCLVEDSLKGISESVGTMEEHKKGLKVEFVGEDGIDAGGLRKEWFLLLAREVFDPNYGLFISEDDSNYCYFNPHSFESTEEFYLVGTLLGLAIYNSTILDISLPPYVFRKLMHSAPLPANAKASPERRPPPPFRRTLEDLAVIRPGLARGLQQLLNFEGDVESTFCRDFVAEIERYGEKVLVPLCPGGESKPVTNENRKEFVDLYLKYILDTSVARQFEPFKRGFYIVCGGNALSLLGPEEVELIIRGSGEPLDVHALKAVAVYDGFGPPLVAEQDTVVRWFWGFFEKSSPEHQRMLLSFITGSDRIPATGTTSLIIKVACIGPDCDRYPVARTCFNQICLYRYRKREKFEKMLWGAVTESEGFGLK